MLRTQVELTGPATRVFWLNAKEGTLKPGDQVELTETSGRWTVAKVCVSLPAKALEGLPHRTGTIRKRFKCSSQ